MSFVPVRGTFPAILLSPLKLMEYLFLCHFLVIASLLPAISIRKYLSSFCGMFHKLILKAQKLKFNSVLIPLSTLAFFFQTVWAQIATCSQIWLCSGLSFHNIKIGFSLTFSARTSIVYWGDLPKRSIKSSESESEPSFWLGSEDLFLPAWSLVLSAHSCDCLQKPFSQFVRLFVACVCGQTWPTLCYTLWEPCVGARSSAAPLACRRDPSLQN